MVIGFEFWAFGLELASRFLRKLKWILRKGLPDCWMGSGALYGNIQEITYPVIVVSNHSALSFDI